MELASPLSIGLLILLTCAEVVSATAPLLLSPYLEKGQVELARSHSSVSVHNASVVLESYSGFITVDKKLKNHLFFWFFPSALNSSAPLLIWLNGGPGVSSMLGLFWENGPLEVEWRSYMNRDGIGIKKREHSWADPFAMLYIDNPVNVGFSFTESGDAGIRTTQEAISKDLYSFIEQFYQIFPEYKQRELYIGGQSYAGKYVPSIAYYIDQQRMSNLTDIPLTGIYLGGPFYDPPVQTLSYYDYLYSVGVFSHAQIVLYKQETTRLLERFYAGELHNVQLFLILDTVLKKNDIPTLDNYVTGEPADYYLVNTFMNAPSIREAVHAGNRTFTIINNTLNHKFGGDFFVSLKSELAELMNKYKVLIFTGDYDVIVSSVMVESALLTTPWQHQAEYNASHRSPWWSSEGQLRGFYSKTGQFCRVVVKGAGHQTPHDQPQASFEMMEQFIGHGCVVKPGKRPPRLKNVTVAAAKPETPCSTGATWKYGPQTVQVAVVFFVLTLARPIGRL